MFGSLVCFRILFICFSTLILDDCNETQEYSIKDASIKLIFFNHFYTINLNEIAPNRDRFPLSFFTFGPLKYRSRSQLFSDWPDFNTFPIFFARIKVDNSSHKLSLYNRFSSILPLLAISADRL